MEMNELKDSMDTIRKTAGDLIESIGEQFRELRQQRENHSELDEEKYFLEAQGNEFAIYQIPNEGRGRENLFVNMDFLKLYGREVDSLSYKMVYHRELNAEFPEDLDRIYFEFNTHHPEGYEGRSLSVSDIVVMKQEGEIRAYFTDDVGFKEAPYFVHDRENYLQVKESIDDKGIVMEDSVGIEVEQHEGTWHTKEARELNGKTFYLMEHDEFGDSVANVIVDGNGILIAQELENGFDDGAMLAIKESLEGMDIPVFDSYLKVEEPTMKEVYPHSLNEARDKGELDEYRDSYNANLACKNDIESEISKHFDGLILDNDAIDSVIEKYGLERVSYVLASTLEMKWQDGRFSEANKAWAREQHTVEDPDMYGNDRRMDFMVDSHPAVLNGVIDRFLEKFRIQEVSEDLERAYKLPDEKGYLYIQEYSEGGYDYTFYDKNYKDLDGGVYDDPDISMDDTVAELLKSEYGISADECEAIDPDDLYDRVERAEYFSEENYQALSDLMNGEQDKIAFTNKFGYVAVEKYEDGYDYTILDQDYKEIGGNTYLYPEATMEEVIGWIFKEEGIGNLECKPMSHEELKNSVLKAALDRLSEETLTLTSQISMREESLNGQSRHDIEESVLCHAQAEIDEMGLEGEVKLLAARVFGSRAREGLYKEDSDVDVVLSYSGDIREDTFFNILNESGMQIAGLPIDINPISLEKTGNLREYMKNAEEYLDSKMEEKEATISFYVAECMEFPVMGEYHSDLSSVQEALKVYESIPSERMNGGKGIGFDLQDGSIYDGEYPMMSHGRIDIENINMIEHYRNSPLVQQAIKDLQNEMGVDIPKDVVKVPVEQKKEKSQVSKKESVLQALKERQNKLKENEKTQPKDKSLKKGDMEL